MPAKAKLFDAKADAVFDFGAASRNTVQFNPQGTCTLPTLPRTRFLPGS